MMDCTTVREALPLYAGGDLPPAESGAVEAHLDTCPACRAEAETWRRDLAAALGDDAPPRDLNPQRLEAMIATAATHLGRRRGLRSPRSWVPLAAAAAVAALLLWPALRPAGGPRTSPTLATLETIFGGCMEFPVMLDGWEADRGPGVVAVLRPGKRGGLELADCIEAPDLSRLMTYPWAEQRIASWRRDTGDRGLMVAVCRTDDGMAERRRLRHQVLEELGPAGPD